MEGKVNNSEKAFEAARNIIEQINTLLLSTANPSDDTSLSIRLSMIKVREKIANFELCFVLIITLEFPDSLQTEMCQDVNSFELVFLYDTDLFHNFISSFLVNKFRLKLIVLQLFLYITRVSTCPCNGEKSEK